MKTFLTSVFAAIVALSAQRCTEEVALHEQVRFDIEINNADGQSIMGNTARTSLIVTIETVSGAPVITSQPVVFTQLEQGFVTEPLDLKKGEYTITEFMLIDEVGNIMFAIPQRNSVLSGAVISPLSFRLSVTGEPNQNIQMELLAVAKYKPEDFGMTSFKRTSSFGIQAITPDGKPIAARAAILHGVDTLAKYELGAKMNFLVFEGNAGEKYTLTVTRKAYTTFTLPFTTASSKKMFDKKVIHALLQPAFTLIGSAQIDPEYPPLHFYVGGTGGSITIDWGDSIIETRDLVLPDMFLGHYYAEAREYPITITGDLDKITVFDSFYGFGLFSEIRFDHLVNIETISYGLTPSPKVIDLSHNKQLRTVNLPNLRNMEHLYLPQEHQINKIIIDGPNQLGTSSVDAVIDNIYTNTIDQDIRDGSFSLSTSWKPYETDSTMVGPPSSAALIKLELLHQHYGWFIWPNAEPVEQ